MVGSHWGRDSRAHWDRESCHIDDICNTNGNIASVGCGISLLDRILSAINVNFLLISHHMSNVTWWLEELNPWEVSNVCDSPYLHQYIA